MVCMRWGFTWDGITLSWSPIDLDTGNLPHSKPGLRKREGQGRGRSMGRRSYSTMPSSSPLLLFSLPHPLYWLHAFDPASIPLWLAPMRALRSFNHALAQELTGVLCGSWGEQSVPPPACTTGTPSTVRLLHQRRRVSQVFLLTQSAPPPLQRFLMLCIAGTGVG
jgi:hypothetical protein